MMRLGRYAVVALGIAMMVVPGWAADQATPEKKSGHMWAALNLNDDQKAKLKELRNEMKEKRSGHFEKMKAVRTKTREELLKNNPSKDVLYTYARELGELHKSMAEMHADHLLKVKKVLTQEQFAKLVDLSEGKMGGKGMANCPHKGQGMKGKGCEHGGEKGMAGKGCHHGGPDGMDSEDSEKIE